MLGNKAKRELKIHQRRVLIDSIEIGIPSPQQILTWGKRKLPNGKSVGEIKNSKTVNYKRFTPLRDGLFCERIFGPVNSFICACGKRQPRADTLYCEKCEVEYTDQRARRYRLGYIPLISPVVHIWYLKGRPSYISLFLGKRKKKITALTYCNAYLVEQALPNSLMASTPTRTKGSLTPVEQTRSNRALMVTQKTAKKRLLTKNTLLAEIKADKTNPLFFVSPIENSWIKKQQKHGTNKYTKIRKSYTKNRQVSKIFYNSTKFYFNTNTSKQSSGKAALLSKPDCFARLAAASIEKKKLQDQIQNKTGPSSFSILLLEVLGKIEKDLVLIDFTRKKKSCTSQYNLLKDKKSLRQNRSKDSQVLFDRQFFLQDSIFPFQGQQNIRALHLPPKNWVGVADTQANFESSQSIKDVFDSKGKNDKKELQSKFFLKPLWGYTYSEKKGKDLRYMENFIISNRNPISMLSYCSTFEQEHKIASISVPTSGAGFQQTSRALCALLEKQSTQGTQGKNCHQHNFNTSSQSLTSTVGLQKKKLRSKIEKNTRIFSTDAYLRLDKSNNVQKYTKKFYGNKKNIKNIEQIQSVLTDNFNHKNSFNDVNLSNKQHNLSVSNTIEETAFSSNRKYFQYGMNSYHRPHTLPFLPSLICKYYLRDELLNLFSCSPLNKDKPIPIYCDIPRWTPLRNVHQFMSEQILYKKDFLPEQTTQKDVKTPIRNKKLNSQLADVNHTTFSNHISEKAVFALCAPYTSGQTFLPCETSRQDVVHTTQNDQITSNDEVLTEYAYNSNLVLSSTKQKNESKAKKSNRLLPLPLLQNEKNLERDSTNQKDKSVLTDATNRLHCKHHTTKRYTLAEQLASARHLLYMVLLQKSSSLKFTNLANRICSLSALLTSFSREKLIHNSIQLSPYGHHALTQLPKRSHLTSRQRNLLFQNFDPTKDVIHLENETKELWASSSTIKNSFLQIKGRIKRLQKQPTLLQFTRSLFWHNKRNNDLKQSLLALMKPFMEKIDITKNSYKIRNFQIPSPEKLYSTLLLDNAWIRSSVLQKNMSYWPIVEDIALARLPITEKLPQLVCRTNRLKKKQIGGDSDNFLLVTAFKQEKNSNFNGTNSTLIAAKLRQLSFYLRQQTIVVPSLSHALRQQSYNLQKRLDLNFLELKLNSIGYEEFVQPSRILRNQSKQELRDLSLHEHDIRNGNCLNTKISWYLGANNLKLHTDFFELRSKKAAVSSVIGNEKIRIKEVHEKSASIEPTLLEEKRLINKSFYLSELRSKKFSNQLCETIWSADANRFQLLDENKKNLNSLTFKKMKTNFTKIEKQSLDQEIAGQNEVLRRKQALPSQHFSIGRLPVIFSTTKQNKGACPLVCLPCSASKASKAHKHFKEDSVVQSSSLSPLEFKTIREILAYTGGGALQRLLQRFDTQRFASFLLADIHATQSLYKKRVIKNEFSSSRIDKRIIARLCRRIYKNSRRLKIAQLLTRCKSLPEWMLISVLPVLPPDLRPILQMSENVVVASDLNNLYQRVIYRNNRFQKLSFIDFHLVTAIQRLVQDAVDRLIENGRGGSKPFYTSSGRPLRSLSDTLKGKKGRFRLNLLGKRVDFSGRSVIVVSPTLKIHECGLPREIALELYHYFLLRDFMLKKRASSIVTAKRIIKQRKSSMWNTLQAIIYHHPVLLNRAPTLHRLGIQAFQPKLVRGNAILLHPLVCSGFNADFDGDQMGVHLPLCIQARAEAWDLLWSRNNLLSPATGQPVLVPSQDMVLGFYYMTQCLSSRTSISSDQHTSLLRKASSETGWQLPALPGLVLQNRHTSGQVPLPALLAKQSKQSRQAGWLDNETNKKFLNTKSNHFNFEQKMETPVHLKGKQKICSIVKDLALVNRFFLNSFELVRAFQKEQILLHTPVWLKWKGKIETDEGSDLPLEIRLNSCGNTTYIYSKYKRKKEEHTSYSNTYARTTAGRVLVNQILFSLYTLSYRSSDKSTL